MIPGTANAVASSKQYSILVVSDKPVLRYGLGRLFSLDPNLELLEEADGVPQALEKVVTKRPDLVLVGLPLEGHGIDGLGGLITQLKAKYPPLKVLAGVRCDDPSLLGRMLRDGADGCVHWGEPVAQILAAVQTVLQGGSYVGSCEATCLPDLAIRGTPLDGHAAKSLSDREWHVLMLIGQGLTTKQIAEELDVSQRTVESHRKQIKLKFGLRSVAQLNRIAYESWQELR